MNTKKSKKKTFEVLKKQIYKLVSELLEYDDGAYDGNNTHHRLEDGDAEVLSKVLAVVADTESLLADLGKRVKTELKSLKSDNYSDFRDLIFKKKSCLALFRWIEEEFNDSVDVFDAVEAQTGARCDIDEFLKDILADLP